FGRDGTAHVTNRLAGYRADAHEPCLSRSNATAKSFVQSTEKRTGDVGARQDHIIDFSLGRSVNRVNRRAIDVDLGIDGHLVSGSDLGELLAEDFTPAVRSRQEYPLPGYPVDQSFGQAL